MSAEDAETATLVIQNLSSLRDDPSLSDVVVVVGDNEFQCHRLILESVSDFFKAAFANDLKEAREGKITLHGVNRDIFEKILDCIYRGKYILTEENLFNIWIAADMLQIKFLISQCQKLMQKTLSSENAISYLNNVRVFDECSKVVVLVHISKHILSKEIINKKQQITQDDMKFILGQNDVDISEDRIIGFLLSWANVKTQNTTKDSPKSSLDDKDNPGDDLLADTEESVAKSLADLLECTRYMLITDNCLHETLEQHHLVQNNQKCEQLLKKILRYQSQAQVQQSWCPPAAIHRQHSDMVNVLLTSKVNKNGQVWMLDLKSMEWKNVILKNRPFYWATGSVLCYDSNLFTISGNSVSLCSHSNSSWKQTTFCTHRFVRVIGKMIFCYDFQTQKLTVGQIINSAQLQNMFDKAQSSNVVLDDSRLEGMDIKEVTSIGNTHVAFLGGDSLDNYTIVCINPVYYKYNIQENQLGSQSKLVTFSHEREVFVLQENGCLWRMRQKMVDFTGIDLTQELVLWENEVSLTGAVLYNDELLIVGKFPDQAQNVEILDRSLDGVFKGVKKVKCNLDLDNKCPRISLAVLPKSLLNW